jgi:hypothetical protein
LAKAAIDRRALSRKRESSWRSVESMIPTLYKTATNSDDMTNITGLLIYFLAIL